MFFKVQDASTGNHIASCLRLLSISVNVWFRNLLKWRALVLIATQASFFLDPYARPGETLARSLLPAPTCPASNTKPRKRGGAWMDDCLGRSKAAHLND